MIVACDTAETHERVRAFCKENDIDGSFTRDSYSRDFLSIVSFWNITEQQIMLMKLSV